MAHAQARAAIVTAVSRQRFPQAVGVVVAVYLVAMAAVFALLSAQNAQFVRTASQTQGSVVALVVRAPLGARESRTEARAPSLAPKVSYVVDGRTYEYVAAHGRDRQRLQVGDTVTVLYDPADPATARLRGEGRDSGPLLSIGFALAAVLLVGLIVRLRRRRSGGRHGSDAPRERRPAAAAVAD